MRILSLLLIISLLATGPKARASMFGEENILLGKILMEAIHQLKELQSIVSTGQDTLNLMQQINQGINDSLVLLNTIAPDLDPGLYKDWNKVQTALGKISSIYGEAVPSQEFPVQNDTDQEVAEAVTFNNSIYKYSDEIDAIGEQVKVYSHQVSPGGAQKLTAQTLGVMLNVMNEGLRAQATGLKLTAQNLALQNHKDKEATKAALMQARTLRTLMEEEPVTYETPLF